MIHDAPGAWRAPHDVYGPFNAAPIPERALVLVDKRVHALHPHVMRAVKTRKPLDVVMLQAGEGAKTLDRVKLVATHAHAMKRKDTLVCIGGGTLGDLATVAAHLIKRGVKLVHVPSTLLAAVDSSLGGKGAVHSGGIKNALGAFHYADATWICPELFETLAPKQIREGITEAWKMAVCLDASVFDAWTRAKPELLELIKVSRRMKERVCEQDPYDVEGIRVVLNFGHTFGHVLESLSRFRISHGDAVGLGMRCALDVGRAMGQTPSELATMVERTLERQVGILPREHMADVFSKASLKQVKDVLLGDKKGADAGSVKMVLLREVGKTSSTNVPTEVWSALLNHWRKGRRP